MLAPRVTVQHQAAPAWTLALEQLRQHGMREIAAADALGLVVVVVDTDDIGGDAFPAIVSYHGARRILRFGQVVEGSYVVALGHAVRQVRNSPGFVEGHPRHDAWVIDVSANYVEPLARQALDGSL